MLFIPLIAVIMKTQHIGLGINYARFNTKLQEILCTESDKTNDNLIESIRFLNFTTVYRSVWILSIKIPHGERD